MTKLPKVHPGNVYPNHNNLVKVVAWDIVNKRPFLTQDRRLGKQSWMYWKRVLAWQEIGEQHDDQT